MKQLHDSRGTLSQERFDDQDIHIHNLADSCLRKRLWSPRKTYTDGTFWHFHPMYFSTQRRQKKKRIEDSLLKSRSLVKANSSGSEVWLKLKEVQ